MIRLMWRKFSICVLALLASVAASGQALPTATRIEVRVGNTLRRGVVSEDNGPGSPTMKVRLDPDNNLQIVPRDSVRPAPRPAALKPGARVEWNGGADTSFRYVAATVKEVGSGTWAGYYLVAWDQYPNSPKYTKPDNLWSIPDAAAAAPVTGGGFTPGKYRCFSSNGTSQLFLTALEIRSNGTYVAYGKEGQYRLDSGEITWVSGWAKENDMQGKLEGNAAFRIRRNALCSHE